MCLSYNFLFLIEKLPTFYFRYLLVFILRAFKTHVTYHLKRIYLENRLLSFSVKLHPHRNEILQIIYALLIQETSSPFYNASCFRYNTKSPSIWGHIQYHPFKMGSRKKKLIRSKVFTRQFKLFPFLYSYFFWIHEK